MVGMSFTYNDCDATEPGASGANQTWDFSEALGSPYGNVQIIAPSDAPMGSDFPQASFCANLDNDVYSFLRVDATGLFIVGMGIEGETSVEFANERMEMTFPFTWQNTFSDVYVYTISDEGFTVSTEGTVETTADGYGTVITPAGTYTVLRLHINETVVTTMSMGEGMEISFTDNIETYSWMKPGVPVPVMSITTTTSDDGEGPVTEASFLGDLTIGIEDQEIADVQIYPNPAVDQLRIKTENGTLLSARIVDVKGATVAQMRGTSASESSIDVSQLQSGVYFIQIQTDKGSAVKKFVR